MGSLNKATLIGNLCADPESRDTRGGKVVNLRVATSESYTDKQSGERKEATEYHSVVIWNERVGDFVERHLRKGSQVYVEGKLKTRKFQDSTGNDRFTTEVVVERFGGDVQALGSAPARDGGRGQDRGQRHDERQSNSGRSGNPRHDDLDDEVPF